MTTVLVFAVIVLLLLLLLMFAVRPETNEEMIANFIRRQPRLALPLRLLTPDEFDALPDGTTLECIDGTLVTKGVDAIDRDTRAGRLAYGRRRQ